MRNSTQKTLQNFTANFQFTYVCKNSAKFTQLSNCVCKTNCKNSHKFPVEFAKLCKISHQCAFDCAKTLQNYTQISNIVCAIGCLESFSEHLVKFSFFSLRKQEQQSYEGDVCGGRIFFSKSFSNLFFPKIS